MKNIIAFGLFNNPETPTHVRVMYTLKKIKHKRIKYENSIDLLFRGRQ